MKALVVDDSSFAQRTAQSFLGKLFPGIVIALANNGREGYAAFVQEKPDIVITDLLMPDMTGQQMIQKIREIDSRTPIFVLTADIQKTTKFELVPLGIAGFINKPLERSAADLIKHKVEEYIHADRTS
ncbi:MAG: response regulator [Negativicutes bacterium]|nr:response regulator [Negativicutes bacterium]